MSRLHTNRAMDEEGVLKPQKQVNNTKFTYYNQVDIKNEHKMLVGVEIVESDIEQGRYTCAVKTEKLHLGINRYQVMLADSLLYNPFEDVGQARVYKLTKVNQEAFDLYVLFLNTQKRKFLLQAGRKI